MGKFKVGDKVKIIKPKLASQQKYIGYVCTVKDTLFAGVYLAEMEKDDNFYLDDELEFAKEEKPYIEINKAVNDIVNTKAYDMYVKGIWKNEEEKDMNKVLELYAKRKREEIDKKYEEMVKEDYNGLQLVSEYNRIVTEFEEAMENLYKNELNFGESTIRACYSTSDYKYQLRQDKIMDTIRSAYKDSKSEEIIALGNLLEEVDAQLSLSDDLDYQREILIKYDIIDKKTGKIK